MPSKYAKYLSDDQLLELGVEPAPTPIGSTDKALQEAGQKKILESSDTSTGGDFVTRAGVGIAESDNAKIGYLESKFGAGNVQPITNEKGGIDNFVVRKSPKDRWTLLDPSPTQTGMMGAIKDIPGDIADVSGPIIEAVPGAVAGIVGSRLGMPFAGASTMEAGADAAGSALRQGIASRLPGAEERPFLSRVKEAGVNVLGGLAASGIGSAVKQAAPAISQGTKRAIGTASPETMDAANRADIARGIAGQAGKQSAVYPGTVNQSINDASVVENEVSKGSGEEFRFSAGQKTGSKFALGRERMLSQHPDTMDAMAAEQKKRLDIAQKYQDSVVKYIAGDTSRLSNESVGGRLAGSVTKNLDELLKKRSSIGGPLYDEVDKFVGGKRVIPTNKTMAELKAKIDEDSFDLSKITVQARNAITKISGKGTETGRISIKDMQSLRQYFGKVFRGEETFVEGIASRNDKRIARDVLSAIDRDLDTAANGIADGGAAEALRNANKKWAELTEPVKKASNGTVRKILKLEQDANTETIVAKVETLSREQRRGLLKIVDKVDASSGDTLGQDLRAQLIKNIYEKGGSNQAETEFGKELIAQRSRSNVSPGRMANALTDKGDLIADLFAENPEARMKIKTLVNMHDRLSVGPGWSGSDTIPKALMLGFADAIKKGPSGITEKVEAAIKDAVSSKLFDLDSMVRVMSTPEGVKELEKAIAPAIRQKISPSVAKESIQALSRLSIFAAKDKYNE